VGVEQSRTTEQDDQIAPPHSMTSTAPPEFQEVLHLVVLGRRGIRLQQTADYAFAHRPSQLEVPPVLDDAPAAIGRRRRRKGSARGLINP